MISLLKVGKELKERVDRWIRKVWFTWPDIQEEWYLQSDVIEDYLNLCSGFYYVVSLGDYFIPLIPWKDENPFNSFNFFLIQLFV